MKKVGIAGLLMLLVASMAAPVLAWDFFMKGETEWRYRYWTRLGNDDIFGRMSANNVNLGINHLQTFPTASTTNRGSGTFGVLAGENRFGADMQRTDYRMTVFPRIDVNKAIHVEASVNLTSLGIWSDGQPLVGSGLEATTTNPGYANSLHVPIQDRPVAVNVPNTYVTLQWLKTNITTPILEFSIGYKTSKIGMGLWKHQCNRASASFGVTAHYGPFEIEFSPYFGRDQSAWTLGAARSRIEGNGASQRQEDRRDYFKALLFDIKYTNGPICIQLVSDSYHQPNSQVPDARGAAINPTQTPNEDTLRYRIATAVRYFNGWFFFNAEADWLNRWTSGRGAAESPVLVSQNQNNQAWLYGLETGCLWGPSKLTVNYVRATGDDPSTRQTTEDAAASDQGMSACYMKDWGYLMYYMYGAGDGWDATGCGQPTNFHHAGAKIDYAVASNLNLFVLGAYAWRDQPNAYRLGGNYRLGIQDWTNEDIRLAQTGTFTGHAAPDHAGNIGWEIDLGANWKVLEHLTWNTTFALWRPGAWWSYACPDTASIYRAGIAPNDNPNNPAGEAIATAGRGRRIDPLIAVETTFFIGF
jgi:hypothetical protein